MTDTTDFHKLIRQRIGVLENSNQQSDNNADAVELDQSRVGRLSRMDALQMQQMELALERRQHRELAALKLALKRVQSGDFGVCDECGKSINPKRLEIDLIATLCIDCAEQAENK